MGADGHSNSMLHYTDVAHTVVQIDISGKNSCLTFPVTPCDRAPDTSRALHTVTTKVQSLPMLSLLELLVTVCDLQGRFIITKCQ